MTALASRPASILRRPPRASARDRDTVATRLWLRPTHDGCDLIDAAGRTIFHGQGRGGRIACLMFARDTGVPLIEM